jgi:hypothetical protein
MEKLAKAGYVQGDMDAHVADYQLPNSSFSQEFLGQTLKYVERQDKIQNEHSKDLKKQAYKGRYS